MRGGAKTQISMITMVTLNYVKLQVHCEGLVTSPGVVHVNVVHLFTCTTPEHVQQDI